MKRLNTNAVTSDVGLVLQHKHLDFLQDKTQESLIHSIYSQNGKNTTSPIVLWGCIPTYTTTTVPNDTLAITSGAISYNGAIYEVDASTVVLTGSLVHVLKLTPVSYDALDPSLFTDNIQRNVMEIRKIHLSAAATGTGIGNWSFVRFMNLTENGVCNSQNSFDILFMPSGPTGAITSANYNVIKSGNFVRVDVYIVYNITALGGGNNWVDFKIIPRGYLKPGANKSVISSIKNTQTTYDSGDLGVVSADSSGNLNTNYDNGDIAIVANNQIMRISVTYLTA